MIAKDNILFQIKWGGEEIVIPQVEIDAVQPAPELMAMAEGQFSRHMNLYGIHGISHWKRVRENGLVLSRLNAANPTVIVLFAIFHDCQRTNEGEDRIHGPAAAQYLSQNRSQIPIHDGDFDLLHRACFYHNSPTNVDPDITVMTCWDADRLDLARVGKRPNPKYLCTREARDERIIEWAIKRSLADWI